jgi:hypothetical protein
MVVEYARTREDQIASHPLGIYSTRGKAEEHVAKLREENEEDTGDLSDYDVVEVEVDKVIE